MKVKIEFDREDGKPGIDIIAENEQELDTLSLLASFDEVHISWDRHELPEEVETI
jgi:hypothetical protein